MYTRYSTDSFQLLTSRSTPNQIVTSNDSNYTYFFTQPLTGEFDKDLTKAQGDATNGWNGDCRFKDADGNILGYAENTQANGGMPDDPQWVSAGYLENVDSFQLARSVQASSHVSISGIKLNGRLLSQAYRPGRDESGQGNDFLDENFSVAPYVPGDNIADWVGTDDNWMWVVNGTTQSDSGILRRESLLELQLALTTAALLAMVTLAIFAIPDSPIIGSKIELCVNVFGDSFASRDVKFKPVGAGEISIRSKLVTTLIHTGRILQQTALMVLSMLNSVPTEVAMATDLRADCMHSE